MTKKKVRGDKESNLVVKHGKDGKLMLVKRNPIKSKEDRYVEEHHEGSFGITEKQFTKLLTKASQPIEHETKSDLEKSGT
jgi:hypothetical protein